MKRYWELFSAKVETLVRRERILVLLAAVVCVVALLNAVLLDPLAARKKILQDRMANERQQVSAMQQQIQALISAGSVDPDRDNKTRLAELQASQVQIDAALESLQQGLVSPDKMPRLLESMLHKDARLKLVAMKTLPVTGMTGQVVAAAKPPVEPAAATQPVEDTLPIFRHGVQLTVQGRYLDLIDYLSSLEKLPWRVVWGGISLEAGEYPLSTMTVTIYTLSLDKAWLSI